MGQAGAGSWHRHARCGHAGGHTAGGRFPNLAAARGRERRLTCGRTPSRAASGQGSADVGQQGSGQLSRAPSLSEVFAGTPLQPNSSPQRRSQSSPWATSRTYICGSGSFLGEGERVSQGPRESSGRTGGHRPHREPWWHAGEVTRCSAVSHTALAGERRVTCPSLRDPALAGLTSPQSASAFIRAITSKGTWSARPRRVGDPLRGGVELPRRQLLPGVRNHQGCGLPAAPRPGSAP